MFQIDCLQPVCLSKIRKWDGARVLKREEIGTRQGCGTHVHVSSQPFSSIPLFLRSRSRRWTLVGLYEKRPAQSGASSKRMSILKIIARVYKTCLSLKKYSILMAYNYRDPRGVAQLWSIVHEKQPRRVIIIIIYGMIRVESQNFL